MNYFIVRKIDSQTILSQAELVKNVKLFQCLVFSAKCNIYISRLCYNVTVCLWRLCIVVTGAMDPGYLCMLG